jgi:hypothetical protein
MGLSFGADGRRRTPAGGAGGREDAGGRGDAFGNAVRATGLRGCRGVRVRDFTIDRFCHAGSALRRSPKAGTLAR